VSHQMQAITNLCNRAILLEQGKIVERGDANKVVDKYLNEKATGKIDPISERKDRQGNGCIKIIDTWVENKNNHRVTRVQTGDTITICAKYKIIDNNFDKKVTTAFAINTIQNIQISDLSNNTTGDEIIISKHEGGIIRCTINKLPVNIGIYTYNIWVSTIGGDILDYIAEAGRFDVIEGDYFGTGKITLSDRLMMMEHSWEISSDE